jgi:hypothetical protein
MATTSTSTTKAALLQGIPPSPPAAEDKPARPAPTAAEEKPAKPARNAKQATQAALPDQGEGARAKPIPEPAGKAVDKDPSFGESGAFNINDQWSTAVRYDAKMIGGQVSELSVKFTNGRKQVAAVDFKSRDTAVDVLGERNVANIEAGLGKEAAQDKPPAKVDKAPRPSKDETVAAVKADLESLSRLERGPDQVKAGAKMTESAKANPDYRQALHDELATYRSEAMVSGAELKRRRETISRGADVPAPHAYADGYGAANVALNRADDELALEAKTSYSKGKLQAEHLAFKKSYTLDRKPENVIEPDTARDAQVETDAEVRKWVAGRREQLRQRNDKATDGKAPEPGAAQADPGRAGAAAAKPNLDKDAGAAGPGAGTAPAGPGGDSKEDRKNAVPEHVSKRFLQADDKYYFPDKTFAFQDRGAKLATNSENQEVVRSLIAIAEARGWDNITVRGSEEFRRSAWLEASTQGIEVRGYKPTAVEKAHLASILDKLDKEGERGADLPNSISKGRDRAANQEQAPDSPETAQAAPQGVKTPTVTTRPGATVGKLVDHGEADYQNDPKKEKSYFVTVETARGQKTVWGVDLDRAMSESGVKIGENISLEKLGKEPVTAKEKVYDKAGNQTGTRDVAAERNRWLVGSMDKAQAFATGERADVVAKHPDLAPAYGTMAVARKLAEQEWPDNKERQEHFVAATQQVLAGKIASGEHVPAPKIRETRTQEQAPQTKDKVAGKELERERG